VIQFEDWVDTVCRHLLRDVDDVKKYTPIEKGPVVGTWHGASAP
jgi:hypothetical protein